jgi:hypothetical protein
VLVPLLEQRQRGALAVERHGRAARRVHADAHDLIRREALHRFACGSERPFDGDLRALEIVGGVLSGQVRVAPKNHPLGAVGIGPDRRGDFPAVGDMDEQGTNRVGAVIQADGVLDCHNQGEFQLLMITLKDQAAGMRSVARCRQSWAEVFGSTTEYRIG